ncbi:MAG: phosphoglycerate kinase [Gemmatimonadales bacterium]
MKRSLGALDPARLDGQRALVRVDFNVPVADGTVTDDTRLRAALPTIKYLRGRGARVILCSHLGRPKGGPEPRYSLAQLVQPFEALLGVPVSFIADPVGDSAAPFTRRMPRGGVALCENTRFWPGEEQNDPELAARFAALGDLFVNDAFGAAHRAHATTTGVARLLKPAVAGFLMEKELKYLGATLTDPKRPFLAVLGGAKVSGKLDLIEALLPRVDQILLGGAMACTFFRAMGLEMGKSLVEEDRIAMASDLLARAGDKLVLPKGCVIAPELREGITTMSVPRNKVPASFAVFDIDPATMREYAGRILQAGTVIWNGPMGVFETPPFDAGTRALAGAMADAAAAGVITIVGGGDSAAAVTQAGLADRMTHVSTGGGASLEFLEGKTLPGVAALDDA